MFLLLLLLLILVFQAAATVWFRSTDGHYSICLKIIYSILHTIHAYWTVSSVHSNVIQIFVMADHCILLLYFLFYCIYTVLYKYRKCICSPRRTGFFETTVSMQYKYKMKIKCVVEKVAEKKSRALLGETYILYITVCNSIQYTEYYFLFTTLFYSFSTTCCTWC